MILIYFLPFKQLAIPDLIPELINGQEEVISPVYFIGPGWTAGGRDGEFQAQAGLQQASYDRCFSRPGGRTDDDEFPFHFTGYLPVVL